MNKGLLTKPSYETYNFSFWVRNIESCGVDGMRKKEITPITSVNSPSYYDDRISSICKTINSKTNEDEDPCPSRFSTDPIHVLDCSGEQSRERS